MEPLQIVLIVLALAGVWALIELALAFRRARGTVDSLDRTVTELNGALEEARPVVSKLDCAIDELQPALSQVEPLLKEANVAVGALSADLVEVNGVLRDVSQVTGAAGAASDAVSGIADAASEKVQRLFNRGKRSAGPDAGGLALSESRQTSGDREGEPGSLPDEAPAEPGGQYYTYASSEEPTDE